MPSISGREVYLALKRRLVMSVPRGEAIDVQMLQAELRSSQVPIRESLIALSAEGLVEHIPGRGFFTRPYSIAEVATCFQVAELILTAGISTPDAAGMSRRKFVRDLRKDQDIFEMISVFCTSIARIHGTSRAFFLSLILFRCGGILIRDAKRHGECLRTAARAYLLSSTDDRTTKRNLSKFWQSRIERLPSLLSYPGSDSPEFASIRRV